jgi:putative transposase
VRHFAVIGIEGLNVRGMMANGKLARSIADMGFHAFRRQLDYKAAMAGSQIVVANRWYPSSKTCSDCGHIVETLPLSVREWDCPACGAHHDRDVNAARNLEKMAASSAVTACGEDGSGPGRKTRAKPASVKQESSAKATYA